MVFLFSCGGALSLREFFINNISFKLSSQNLAASRFHYCVPATLTPAALKTNVTFIRLHVQQQLCLLYSEVEVACNGPFSLTALFTKPSDCMLPAGTVFWDRSSIHSLWTFFPFCMERLVTMVSMALWIAVIASVSGFVYTYRQSNRFSYCLEMGSVYAFGNVNTER